MARPPTHARGTQRWTRALPWIAATRALPLIAATGALLAVLAATQRYGLGVSMDSVAYARAAESLTTRGRLEVPTTWWDSDAAYAPLSHFPPGLPVALAALGAVLDVDPYVAARWLNAAAVFALVLAVLLPVADSAVAMLAVAALLAAPAFVTLYVWLWSEPLFLLLLVVAVRLAERAWRDGSIGSAVWLGVMTGLATLTRYAGLSFFLGLAVVLAVARRPLATRLRQLLSFGGAYGAVVAPWLWWLSDTGGSPRALGFYADHAAARIVRPLARTVVHWFVPVSLALPGPLVLVVAAALVGAAGLVAVRCVRAGTDVRIGAAAAIAAILLVVHVLFLVSARLFADPGISFDDRMLAAALVLSAIGIGALAQAAFPNGMPPVPVVVLASLLLANLAATAPRLRESARQGLGYVSEAWVRSETLDWLRRTASPGRTVFSNAPDVICSWLPVTAKFTPAVRESARLAEFGARVARATPAVVVLFDDPHAGWLMARDRLAATLRADETHELADGVILTWGAPGS